MFTQAMGQATSVSEESKRAVIEQLNEEGNVLFRSRKFSAALDKYKGAVGIDPVSPLASRSLRNMKVVRFECSRYTECIQSIKDIPELMGVQNLDDKTAISKLELPLKGAYAHVLTSSQQEQLQRRLKVFACLPPHRASMQAFCIYMIERGQY